MSSNRHRTSKLCATYICRLVELYSKAVHVHTVGISPLVDWNIELPH